MTSQNRNQRLMDAYDRERGRLLALADADLPQGDYAHPVFGLGDPCAQTVFIGEAPGREEAECGRPFVGKAGKQLDQLLESAGIERAAVYVTNVVKYRPVIRGARSLRNRTPGRKEIEQALALLAFELQTIAPQTVVTLGNTPLAAILQLAGLPPETIGTLHGRAQPVTFAHGRPATLFPLYHPASGIYNPALLPVLRQDMHALGEHLVKARERTSFGESDMV